MDSLDTLQDRNALHATHTCSQDHVDEQLHQFIITVEERLAYVKLEIHQHLDHCVNEISAFLDNLACEIDKEHSEGTTHVSSVLERVNAQLVQWNCDIGHQETIPRHIAEILVDLFQRTEKLDADFQAQGESVSTQIARLSHEFFSMEEDLKTRVAELAAVVEDTKGLWENSMMKVPSADGPDILKEPLQSPSELTDSALSPCSLMSFRLNSHNYLTTLSQPPTFIRNSFGGSLAQIDQPPSLSAFSLPSMKEETLTSDVEASAAELHGEVDSDAANSTVCYSKYPSEVSKRLGTNELQLSSVLSTASTTKTCTGSVSSRYQARDIEEPMNRMRRDLKAISINFQDLAERLEKESAERHTNEMTFAAWVVRLEREVKDLVISWLNEKQNFSSASSRRYPNSGSHVGLQGTWVEHGRDTFFEQNPASRDKLTTMMGSTKSAPKRKIPVHVSCERSLPKSAPVHAPQMLRQGREPRQKDSVPFALMPPSEPINSSVAGQVTLIEGVSVGDAVNESAALSVNVQIPVTVDAESWQQQKPQHQPQQQKHSTPNNNLTGVCHPKPQSSKPASMHVPVACFVDGSISPVGSARARGRSGGSMHVPSMGSVWCSAVNSTTQQQSTSLTGPASGPFFQEKVVSSMASPSNMISPHTPTVPRRSVLQPSTPVSVCVGSSVGSQSINDTLSRTIQHYTPVDKLTRTTGDKPRTTVDQQWRTLNRSCSLERLGATVSPSNQVRHITSMPLPSVVPIVTTCSTTMSGVPDICRG